MLDYANKRSFVNKNLVVYRYGSNFLSICFIGFSVSLSFNLKLFNFSMSCHLVKRLILEVTLYLFEITAIKWKNMLFVCVICESKHKFETIEIFLWHEQAFVDQFISEDFSKIIGIFSSTMRNDKFTVLVAWLKSFLKGFDDSCSNKMWFVVSD